MSRKRHTLKALLSPSPFKNSTGDYIAHTMLERTMGIKEICKSYINRPGTEVRFDAMEYHVKLFLEEMSRLLVEGHYVNTGYFTAGATVKGSFEDKSETFNSDKHKVNFTFSQGNLMSKQASKIKADIVPYNRAVKFGIIKVHDNGSCTTNDELTPGSTLAIDGMKIKITGDHPEVGLYFINDTTGEKTRLTETNILQNHHNRLLIMLPPLEEGSYHLMLGTQYAGNSSVLVKPHLATFDIALRVVKALLV